MYAVIFTATLKHLDEEYSATVAKMRDLAFNHYGCLALDSVCDGSKEITISNWPSLEHISAWHADPMHQAAQALGKAKWYTEFSVQVTYVERNYRMNLATDQTN
ncbi:antibiotic biosynthesis monooxygenase family protein [Teredinibacter waterburyi]|jgi:hypothetical protein|uniref:antibiotic biosynthesis monooxygenase family protein n=1 Tax=Teredinibacter waterburyi TaxID=1500538 RepID=UPI00165FC4B5|nr:antibiotic biosynthesis monooxygenase [Teredinibacter waterburyi]